MWRWAAIFAAGSSEAVVPASFRRARALVNVGQLPQILSKQRIAQIAQIGVNWQLMCFEAAYVAALTFIVIGLLLLPDHGDPP